MSVKTNHNNKEESNKMRVYGKANMARVYSFIVTVALLISLVPVTAQLALADDTDMSGEDHVLLTK